VIHGFQVGPARWSAGHRGVDLAARSGAEVRAPANGTVVFAGVLAGRPVLSIDHGGGLISSFEPALSRLQRGDSVERGEVVATLGPGPTHCWPTSCLHWGVRQNGRYIDPLTLLPGQHGPAVLLPMLS
jgi:murein DD-endopeptidase MepM/ murein hydrolase activator NlpD